MVALMSVWILEMMKDENDVCLKCINLKKMYQPPVIF